MTGQNEWVQAGLAEGWNTTQLNYFTDPGDLAASVSHAQADAMVAAAAAVWNVPTSSLTIAQGGELAEHVSSSNTYFNGTSLIFPADVQTNNEAVMPVAVVYDTDGSITDLLLGSGASEPLECRQYAVTESVDDIQPDGHIHHAVIVLNGRCVGSTPEGLTQMRYQLARAFGRVLGLAWSQTNENVFTAASTVTADQETYWPLMHPLDVICGTYTYQCMSNPFTLRQDDLSGLGALYSVPQGAVPAGKQATGAGAVTFFVVSMFPTGQGMDWVNFTARRFRFGFMEDFELVSGTTGIYYQQSLTSPVTLANATNSGQNGSVYEGIGVLRAVPVAPVSNVYMTSEPIDPLYTAEYALGPYVRPTVTPSGSAQTVVGWSALPASDTAAGFNSVAGDAASSCSPGNDGTQGAPAPLDASGWQAGLLCGWGHSSWWSYSVHAGRSYTLEVTATDESGRATISKAQTVIGVWNTSDPTGGQPTVASQAVPFNSMAYGVTQLRMPAPATDTSLRFVVGDEFGAGRPDFTYTTRLLYADTVSPASVGSGGGTITISGSGFRQGNLVLVNGIPAQVQSWTATQIVAFAPTLALVSVGPGVPVSVSVRDPSTNGQTTIPGALTYTVAPNQLRLVSAPPGLETGVTAATAFAVQVVASDGMAPVAGTTVSFAVTAGSATLGICAASTTCTGVSNSNGIVQTTVAGVALGAVTLTATAANVAPPGPGAQSTVAGASAASAQVSLVDVDPVRSANLSSTAQYVAAGSGGSWTVQLTALQDAAGLAGVPVSWSASSGLSLEAAQAVTGAGGLASATVSAAAVPAGSASTLTGCVWNSVCVTWTLNGVDPSLWQVTVLQGAGQSVSASGTLTQVTLLITDGSGHPVEGAPVNLYQRVLAWEGACAAAGACPAAPVLATSQDAIISGLDGTAAITPLQVAGVPQTLQAAAASGTIGFVTWTLVKIPNLQ